MRYTIKNRMIFYNWVFHQLKFVYIGKAISQCNFATPTHLGFPGQHDTKRIGVAKHVIMNANVVATVKSKNLRSTQFYWQFIRPIDLHYLKYSGVLFHLRPFLTHFISISVQCSISQSANPPLSFSLSSDSPLCSHLLHFHINTLTFPRDSIIE